MRITEILTPSRVTYAMSVSSKKRLLEKISQLLSEDEPELDGNAAFQSLVERERLGSTAIGDGIALPHGRLKGLNKVIGAFAVLEQEMDYDTIDQKPVKMVFALLIPENATEEHLQILSQLARIFAAKETRDRLLRATSAEQIYNCLTSQETG